MIVGCYTLHLYCDAPGCLHGEFGMRPKFAEFSGSSEADTRKQARCKGWTLTRDRRAICKECK